LHSADAVQHGSCAVAAGELSASLDAFGTAIAEDVAPSALARCSDRRSLMSSGAGLAAGSPARSARRAPCCRACSLTAKEGIAGRSQKRGEPLQAAQLAVLPETAH